MTTEDFDEATIDFYLVSLRDAEDGIKEKAKYIEKGQKCFLGSIIAVSFVLFFTLAGIAAGVTPFTEQDSESRLPIPNAGID